MAAHVPGAGDGDGKYDCPTCKMKFAFKSKLDRHMQSDDHLMFTQSMAQASQSMDWDQDGDLCDIITQEVLQDEGNYDDLESNNERWMEDTNTGSESELDIEALLHEIENEHWDYSPFPNKTFALLFILLHSPKPMGESNLKFVWFILAKSGVTVPSFSQVKGFKLPGMESPIRCLASNGMPYYMNTISSILRRCIGNPQVSQLLKRFPVTSSSGSYREMFHASRWHNDPRFHSPMTILPDGTHVYVRDCISCKHSDFGIVAAVVVKFFLKDDSEDLYVKLDILLTLEQYKQALPDTLACHVRHGTLIIFDAIEVPIDDVVGTYQKPIYLLHHDHSTGNVHCFSNQECLDYLEPHPFRIKAAGKPVVMLPLVLFSDDTSGNISKKWHKFDSWSISLAGLPRHEKSKIPHLHFLCCSDVLSAMDMTDVLAAELTHLEKEGVESYDAHLKQKVIVVSPLLCVIADNPRASEMLNHLGGSARSYCRMCMVDREVNPTEMDEQRTLISMKEKIEEIKSKTTERERAQLRTKYGIKEISNPLLTIPVDLYQSSPVETLHTILLGPYKYLLKSTIPKLSKDQKEEILSRIRAFNFSGFRVRLVGNVVQYHKSFVGRDYKAWAQMAPFIIFPYLSDGDKAVWLALSKVFKMAYCDYYDPSMSSELKQLGKAFVDAVKQYQPHMLRKQKVHLILHLVECQEQFGPTSAFNSERFETFNSFIRAQNIYGNKHAPSRDIAYKFSVVEHLRHICEGGYFAREQRCSEGLKTLFSLPSVQSFINCTPMREIHSDKAIYQPGAVRIDAKNTQKLTSLSLSLPDHSNVTLCNPPLPFTVQLDPLRQSDVVQEYHGVVGQDGNLIRIGDYVELHCAHGEIKYGLLLMCYKSLDGRSVCVLRGLESMIYPTGSLITNDCDCPLLSLSYFIFSVKTSEIQKAVSVIHQCTETCRFKKTTIPRNIEREDISFSRLEFEHDFCDNHMYCLNIFCV